MTCKILTDESGQASVIMCGSSWGIGCYNDPDYGVIYGFPYDGLDPDDFMPDFDSCTKREIANWQKAKADKARHEW